MKGRANMEKYKEFCEMLDKKLAEYLFNDEQTGVAEGFNRGLKTMRNIALTEFMKLQGEKKDD